MPRIGPRSLAGQLMLVTALALLLAQAINLALLVRCQRHERVAAIAAGAAVQIGEARERLELGVPIDRRGRFRAERLEHDRRHDGSRIDDDEDDRRPETMRRRRVLVDTIPRFRPGMNEWPELAERVSRHFAENGVAVRDVRAAHMDAPAPISAMMGRPRGVQLVAVSARLEDGRWITIRARLPGPAPWLGNMLLVQTLILFALLLGPLLFVAWRVSRPLSRLAEAASDTRPGIDTQAVEESGPEDVRALTRAFNAMRSRIHAMLSEKDHMLGAIGHDLRTPLASLRVRVEQVEDEALRERMAATITDMAAMLDDILSLARAGQPLEQAEQTDLAAMLGAIAADYQAMDRPVSLAPEGAVVSRRIRASSMRRAIRNLVDNAVTYGGSAQLGLAQSSDGSVTISVDDQGPGIPAHRLADMLEPFARMEQSRNRNTGGSGLGLTLARAIAQAEGGTLTLSNRPTGGLSARIILPADG